MKKLFIMMYLVGRLYDDDKKCVVLCVSCFLICAILSSFGCSSDESQIIETKKFLPEPEEITCTFGEKKVTLFDEQRNAVYNEFLRMVKNGISNCEHFEYADQALQNDESNETETDILRVEFRYQECYRYVGELSTEEPLAQKPFEFEAIALSIDPYIGVLMNPCRNGEFYGIDGTATLIEFNGGFSLLYDTVLAMLESS